MRYSRMRELMVKPKLTKKEQRELNSGSAGMPPCRPATPPAERDDDGNLLRTMNIGRSSQRAYRHGTGREKLARSRIQRQTRRQKTGGVQ